MTKHVLLLMIAASLAGFYACQSNSKSVATSHPKSAPVKIKTDDSASEIDSNSIYFLFPSDSNFRQWIVLEKSPLFTDSAMKHCSDTLSSGTIVQLPMDYWEIIYPDTIYRLSYVKNGQRLNGYLPGKVLGIGGPLQDGDDTYILAAHYLDYQFEQFEDGSLDEKQDNPAEIVLMKDTAVISRIPFEGYNSLYFRQANDAGFNPRISLFDLHFGLEACDYDNGDVLFYYKDQQIDSICVNYSMSSAGVVYNYFEYSFPNSRHGIRNQLQTCFHHDEADDKDEDKIIYGTPECTTYVFSDGKFARK